MAPPVTWCFIGLALLRFRAYKAQMPGGGGVKSLSWRRDDLCEQFDVPSTFVSDSLPRNGVVFSQA